MQRLDEVLDAAALAGKIMLESGAEIARVEGTVERLSRAMGADGCEVFATPTAIVMTVTSAEGRVQSIVRRITRRGTKLDRVEAVNALSRRAEAEGIEASALRAELVGIQKSQLYKEPLLWLASGLGAGAFALFFGSGAVAGLCGFAAGVLLRAVQCLLARAKPNQFVENMAGGAVAALCGLVCTLAGLVAGWQVVAVPVLMLMVPGVAITNALRDIAAGELVAGISRAVEAFTIAAALSCGTALVFAAARLLGGVV